MNINLSDETIETVVMALISKRNTLEDMIRRTETGRASIEKRPVFESELEKVKDALGVFEEL